MPEISLVPQLLDALRAVDRLESMRLARAAADEKDPLESVTALVVPALIQLGELWERGDVALSQVYMAGRIAEELIDELLPDRIGAAANMGKRIGIAVLNDYHLLGKRVVISVLRSAGFDALDLGTCDVPTLVRLTGEEMLDILLVSVLMLPSALDVRELKRQLDAAGLERVKLIVGGAPFRIDPLLAKEVGADAFGRSASDVIPLLKSFCSGD